MNDDERKIGRPIFGEDYDPRPSFPDPDPPALVARAAIEGAQAIHLPGQEPVKISATPYVWRNASALPRQQFLYGFELQRGHVSALVAPGAAGKSTYLMARALCMASGLEKFRQRVWNGPHRVWLWNLEDKRLHLERMLQAFCIHYQVGPHELEDRLFLDSAVRNAEGEGDYSPQSLKLGVEVKGEGCVIARPTVQALIDELKAREIDHFDVDPFVSSHSVSENDNGAIDAIAKEWAFVAAEANCSISLAHHIKKIEGREATATDARGATSLINAARSCLVINRMDGEHADACGVPRRERKFYFSMLDGKANRAPPATSLDWFKLVGVGLGNADVGCPGPEDSVATITRFIPPSAFGGVKPSQLQYIQQKITDAGPLACRSSSQSPQWVGFVLADILDIDLTKTAKGTVAPCEGKSKLVAMINAWVENDILRPKMVMDLRSEERACIVAGRDIDPNEI